MATLHTSELEKRNRELSILNAIAQELNRSVELEETLQAALVRMAELLDLQTGWVWLLNETSNAPYLAASLNLPPALASTPRHMEGRCYCLDTYQEGDLAGAANINVITCSRLKHLVDGTDGLRYHASIPLYAHGRSLGVFNVASQDWRELGAEDLRLLHTMGDLLGIAIERARLYERSAQVGAVEERNRLAREIHDTLAQGLSAIALQLETADALLELGIAPERVRATIQRAAHLTRTNLEETRRSVMDLRAAPLEGKSLAQALSDLTAQMGERGAIQATFEAVGAQQPLPPAVEAGLFRIAQEGLENVVGHAQAAQVLVQLTCTPVQVILRVQDDGGGFDPQTRSPNRFGLTGMNERARLLGGGLSIESAPGQGATLEIIVPL